MHRNEGYKREDTGDIKFSNSNDGGSSHSLLLMAMMAMAGRPAASHIMWSSTISIRIAPACTRPQPKPQCNTTCTRPKDLYFIHRLPVDEVNQLE
jgi:hypothetical protein